MELQSLEPPELDKEEQEALIRHHEAEELLKKLTLEEKVSLLTGKTMWEAGGVPRLNLPRLRFSDGPHGARGEGLHGTVGAALAPCLSALAATFNEEIILKVGEILGQECAARGANVLLGPTVNIHRSPITGRHFECFSEDPFLTSRCAVSYVRGVQRFSAACVKHFVGNDQEADRGHSNSVISERVLHEVYLQPFEACVRQAGAQAIMPGYNRLNGQYCAENRHLLQEVLRDTWQFQGLVVSDWWANRTTNKALEAGLNVEMPGIEPRYFGGYLLEQARDGRVSTELLDERCRPILRTLLRFPRTGGTKAPEISKRKAIFTKAAMESLVLLKNSGALPLRTTPVARVAVVGPKARATTLQGGGSSRVHPDRSPSILSELEKALDGSGVQLVHGTGCMMGQRPTKNPELEGLKRMGACDANGQPISFHFEAKLLDVILRIASICSQKEFFRRRVMPCLRPLGLRHTDPDEAHKSIVSMEWGSGDGSGVERRGTMMLWGLLAGGLCGAAAAGVAAAAAGSAALCAALVGAGGALGAIGAEGLRQRHVQALENESRSMTRAEALAADCDATVLVVGTDGFWECEGVDQPHMRLPGRQDELVRRCAAAARAAGKAVVVVLNVGSPKELPWLEDVDAVLLSYFGGECTAASISQCLLGACPAGRLPTSWPRCLAEASSEVARASKMDRPGDVEYHEGLHLGYRNGDLDPAFHFGHGLSYTRFEHSDLQALVNDETSMVIMADTSDREWYVLDETSFAESYETPGMDIAEEGPDFHVLRERGFKYYKRRGMARIYQVSEADLEFLPSRKFWGKGTIPLPLRPGDFLVSRYPDASEIYLSRHGEEVFEPVSPEELVRSQEEMCERFLPLLRGLRVQRRGYSYARPGQVGEFIRTIVDGEQVAKMAVMPGDMVVRMETTDRELQVYSAGAFARDFQLPGEEIQDASPEMQALNSRGYKCYWHQGVALLYQVTEEDVEDFVPGRRFQVPGSLIPSPLRAGDYLEARFPEPKSIFMNRNAIQMYGYGLLPRVVVRNTLDHSSELVAWGKIPETPAQVALSSKFRTAADASTERSEPTEPEDTLSPPPPSAVDRSSSAPELANQGSRLDYVNRLRREVSGLRHSDTLPDEDELRFARSLDEALRNAAAKQMSLVQRWYKTEVALGAPNLISSARGDGEDLGAADAAVAAWVRLIPQGRGLIVLQDGFEYITRDGPRRLLARLLRRHKGLHMLVTLAKNPGQAQGVWEERPLPLLSPQVSELARVVPLEKLSDQEAAKVFVSMLLRRGQDRLLNGLSKEQAVELLQEEKLLRNCRGQLTEVLSVVDEVISAQIPLFERPP